MNREEAIEKAKTKWWVGLSDYEIVKFQLYEPLMCMPFDLFQEAVENTLQRPVWMHEFADPDSLKKEFEGKIKTPNIQNIIDKLTDINPKIKVIPVGFKR